jgi:tetratricopeptide (TPR) repeat protein
MIKDVKSKIGISYTIYGISILILALSVFSLLSPGGYIRKIYLSQATEARPIVWEISQEAISQKPYFGWGTDNFERVFENSYDNRLLQDKYGNEAWFDRSHNVLIDQLVENGYIGLLSYILIYLVTAYVLIGVAIRSINRSERILACAILIYLPLHFLELQTAFDTTVSYPIFAFMIALALSLNTGESWRLNKITSYILASILSISLLYLFIFGFIPFVRAQNAYWNIRIVGSSEGRVREYKQLLASSVDKHAFLWKVTTDLQKGISQKPDILGDIDKYKSLKSELSVLESYHREYVQDHPNHFRAKLSLADILIYQRLFGVDMLTDAQIILDEAIEMSPQSPQPYWMKAVGYLYMRKFDLAREYANMGLKLNTDVTESKKVVKYIEESIKTFPNIDLYFFKQI